MGVNFLGRYYSPDVFTGDTNSMIDFGRMIVKLHLTVDPQAAHPSKAWGKLAEKLTSLACTDMNTPVVCDMLAAAERTGRWTSPTAEEPSYVINVQAPWMDYVVDQACLKLSLDRQGLCGWLQLVNTVTQLLNCPGFGETEIVLPKVAVIMNGEVVLPAGAELGPEDVFKLGRSTHVQVHESRASAKADAKAARPHMDPKGKEEADACRHVVVTDGSGKALHCPCQWAAPGRKKDETDAQYSERRVAWETKRAWAAKKAGIDL